MKELKDYGHNLEENYFWRLPDETGIWIDQLALVHERSVWLMEQLREPARISKIVLWTESEYIQNWELMKDESCGLMLTEEMRRNGEISHGILESCQPRTESEVPDADRVSLIVIGNETEAVRIILEGGQRDLILLEGNQLCVLRREDYPRIARELGKLERPELSKVILSEEPCFTNRAGIKIECFPFYYGRDTGNLIYEEKNKPFLIKLSGEREKLNWMLAHQPGLDTFAWPEKAVYMKKNKERCLAGYEMKKRYATLRMDEIFIRDVDEKVYLALCLELLKNVLFLHMRGILVTDYNLDNFQIDGTNHLIMLDCIGYSVHDHIGHCRAPERQPLMEAPDYSNRTGAIQAEYADLRAVISYVLNDGIWPFDKEGNLRIEKGCGLPYEVLELDTPWKLLKRLGEEYRRKTRYDVVQTGLTRLRNAGPIVNPNLKRRPLLILVENSQFCEGYMDKINECLRAILKKLCCGDGVTAALTDLLVVSFARDVWGIGYGSSVENFREASDWKKDVQRKEIMVYRDWEGSCRLGHALSYAQKILRERQEWYVKRGIPSELPTCITLGSYRVYPKDEPVDETEEKMRSMNEMKEQQNWNFINVKFEEEDSTFLRRLRGDKFWYRSERDVDRIVDLSYQSSLIINY